MVLSGVMTIMTQLSAWRRFSCGFEGEEAGFVLRGDRIWGLREFAEVRDRLWRTVQESRHLGDRLLPVACRAEIALESGLRFYLWGNIICCDLPEREGWRC